VIFNDAVQAIGRGLDVAGVCAIAGGIGLAVLLAARQLWRREPGVYRRFRQQLGRVILLGLELLVAADIIRTVAVSPTLESVGVLSGIVLIRTILSFSLQVELTGMWPWQRGRDGSAEEPAGSGSREAPSGPTSEDGAAPRVSRRGS
jgi:uncharacterized membrane protein